MITDYNNITGRIHTTPQIFPLSYDHSNSMLYKFAFYQTLMNDLNEMNKFIILYKPLDVMIRKALVYA